MQDQIVLEAKNVSKTVASPEGQLTILADVSLGVRAGETLAIVGASGAGNNYFYSPVTCRCSIINHSQRCAVCRNNSKFKLYFKLS